ncbi:MAG TPA: hypothetical protein PK253_12395 [Spirochaetota bacterium]|nr:hypothetical protein [Spirochaetota bacterium]
MEGKAALKQQLLNEISAEIDELFESEENIPKDLYSLEKLISRMGKKVERKALESIDEYNRKSSKKKLPTMQLEVDR